MFLHFSHNLPQLGSGKSDKTQTVVDITCKCNVCGKFELCTFNSKVTLKFLKLPQGPSLYLLDYFLQERCSMTLALPHPSQC